jgi:hypothetical protein
MASTPYKIPFAADEYAYLTSIAESHPPISVGLLVKDVLPRLVTPFTVEPESYRKKHPGDAGPTTKVVYLRIPPAMLAKLDRARGAIPLRPWIREGVLCLGLTPQKILL